MPILAERARRAQLAFAQTGDRHAASLAVTLAQQAGIMLVGFLRASSCNVCAHPERLR